MASKVLRRGQRCLAYLRYLRDPLSRFLPVFLLFNAAVVLGGIGFVALYTQEKLTLLRALYVTYTMVFGEHLLPFPQHWALQLLYVVLPPLGLVVILDGIVQFGGRILRRQPSDREWNLAMIETMRDHVIMCGLGKAGFRTLEVLARLGEQVCILEKNADCPNLAWARQRGFPTVVGSGREHGIFERLGADRAKSIILATDDDLANLEMALDARKVNPDIHVVLRLFDQQLANKIRASFDIPVAISTTAVAAPLFATASSDSSISNAFDVGGTLLVVAHITVETKSELETMTVGALAAPRNLWVLSHRRGESHTLCPADSTELEAGDELTVQTVPEALGAVHALNRTGP